MLTEQNIKLFQKLGLPIYNEDEEQELVFEEVELTKEECFDLCKKTLLLLQNAGCRPYTIFNFKEQCNAVAKKHGEWKEYYSLCAKYIEFFVYKDQSYNRFKGMYIR